MSSNPLSSLSIRTKMRLLFATVVVFGSALAVLGYSQLSDVVDSARTTEHDIETHHATSLIGDALSDLERDLDTYLVLRSATRADAIEEDLARIDSLLVELEPHTEDDGEVADYLAPIVSSAEKLSIDTRELLSVAASDVGAMNRMIVATYNAVDETQQAYREFRLLSLRNVRAAAQEQATAVDGVIMHLMIGLSIMLVMLAGAVVLVRHTVKSIDAVTATALSINSGNLDEEVVVKRDDEVGLLARSFNTMTEQLRNSIATLEQRVDERTAELRGANDQLHVEVRERRAAEEAAQEQAQKLEAAIQELGVAHSKLVQAQKLEAIGGLAAGVAHEVNTPIQFVGDNVRFLQDSFNEVMTFAGAVSNTMAQAEGDWSPAVVAALSSALESIDVDFLEDEIPEAITETLEGVDRISTIVRALKEFSHPGGQDKRPVDLNRVVTNTVAISKNEWKYVADLEVELTEGLDPVEARSGPLGQVILILIVNAAQAIAESNDDGEHGLITVTTRDAGECAIIEIADTGCGIAPEHREKVYDHFFTTKDVGKGSGQGLSIAYSIVTQQHGGGNRLHVRGRRGNHVHDSSAENGKRQA